MVLSFDLLYTTLTHKGFGVLIEMQIGGSFKMVQFLVEENTKVYTAWTLLILSDYNNLLGESGPFLYLPTGCF